MLHRKVKTMAQMNNQGSSGADYSVSRNIQIGDYVISEDLLRAIENQLPGNVRLAFEHAGNLRIAYDAALVSFSQILGRLEQAGIRPVDSRWFRIKAAWYNFTDANAALQAKARPKPCCNKVPRLK